MSEEKAFVGNRPISGGCWRRLEEVETLEVYAETVFVMETLSRLYLLCSSSIHLSIPLYLLIDTLIQSNCMFT
jgi:hypothetical protein